MARKPRVIHDQIAGGRLAICFGGNCLIVEELRAMFNTTADMLRPHHVAHPPWEFVTSDVTGVYQD